MVKKIKAPIVKLAGAGSENLGWRGVEIPFDVKKAFGKSGRVPVRGEVNGFPLRTSLFPRKGEPHFLMLNKQVQKGAGLSELGQIVSIELELDTEERTVETPRILAEILEDEDGLLEYFESFTYSTRKFMADSISNTKSPGAQHRRAERIAMILMEMRDGEAHPPPILEVEFANNPKARSGWKRMSVAQRRGHLWGIFYYQTPESRARRGKQAIQDMVKHAESDATRSKKPLSNIGNVIPAKAGIEARGRKVE